MQKAEGEKSKWARQGGSKWHYRFWGCSERRVPLSVLPGMGGGTIASLKGEHFCHSVTLKSIEREQGNNFWFRGSTE